MRNFILFYLLHYWHWTYKKQKYFNDIFPFLKYPNVKVIYNGWKISPINAKCIISCSLALNYSDIRFPISPKYLPHLCLVHDIITLWNRLFLDITSLNAENLFIFSYQSEYQVPIWYVQYELHSLWRTSHPKTSNIWYFLHS